MNRQGVKERMRVPTNGGLFVFLAVTICLTLLITACSGTSASPESASVDPKNGSVKIVGRNAGDGVILRSSALLDERIGQPWQPRVTTPIDFHTVMFIPEEHLNLTRAPVFRDNVLFWLLEDPR